MSRGRLNHNKEKVMRTSLQHGEVLLVPISGLPKGETSKVLSAIVAHSETGHHHVVVSETPFETVGDVEKHDLYLRLFEPAQLVHQKTTDKHRTLVVPVGDWQVLLKTEYDPFTQLVKKVID